MLKIFITSLIVWGVLLYEEGLTKEVCTTEACKKTAQRLLQYMDVKAKPCDNFYRFACGNFLDNAVLHDDKTQNSSFSQVNEELDDQLRSIVFEKPKSQEPLPLQTMKLMFSLCMDEKRIDSRGVEHAVAKLQEAGGWPILGNWNEDNWSYLETEIRLRNLSIGGGNLFRISISVDAKNTTRRVLTVDQPELGLEREYLVKGEEDPLVKAYYSYMVDIAVMYGADRQTAADKLRQSLLFEIELAKITVPQEERRDFERMYNPYKLGDLMTEMGWINWVELLQSMMPTSMLPIKQNEKIIVNEVEYLMKLEKFLQNYPDEVIANFMIWHAASDMANILTNEMRDRHFEYSKIMYGIITRQPRWKECVAVASSLSLALSSLYIQKFFDETSKKEAVDMTNRIREEIIKDLLEVDWMDEETRKHAEYKASKVVEHIGYPVELTNITNIERHYQDLKINKEHYFEALLDLTRWANDYKFNQLRQPFNKTDWKSHGSVAMVNAFYNPIENSMQFPAGVLQQPFFNAKVPKYINYGAIGFIMAHEITHGFDDQGSQFDADGELRNWWRDESRKNFEEKTKCFIDQYGSFKDNQTQLKLNGVNTQGENVADNGAMKLSYRAYKRLGLEEPGLPGLEQYSSDQLFLLSTANMWCTRYRPEALKFQITVGVHSPAEFRVNGVAKNFPEFSTIFQCTQDSSMNPPEKCAVW